MSALPTSIVIGTGTMGPTTGKPIAVELADAKRHMLFCGGSGSGKTWAMKVLMEGQLARGVPGLVIDTMGDLLGLGLPVRGPQDYERYGLRAPHPEPSAADWELGSKVADLVATKTQVRVLTPCSTAGEQISILPLTGRPLGFDQIPEDELILQADAQAANFLTRVGVKLSRMGGAADNLDLGAATEVLLRCWREDVQLDGSEGLQAFGRALVESTNPRLSEKAQERIRDGLASMELGRQRLWYEGQPLDFDRLLQAPPGKTPLLIVSIGHLDPADRVFVIGQILHAAYNWTASKGASPDRPRLSIIVDELAGDGGKNPIMPPGFVRSHPSGDALRRIARCGRHSGCALMVGSQSPNDVDYKAFSQFSTRLIGKLQTGMDINRATFGIQMDEFVRAKLQGFIATAPAGQMFLVDPRGQFDRVRLRMLGTAHSTIQRADMERYYAQGIWRRIAGPTRRQVEEVPHARAIAQMEGLLRDQAHMPTDARRHIMAAIACLRQAPLAQSA